MISLDKTTIFASVIRAFAVQRFSFLISRFWASEKSVLAIVLLSFLLMGMDGAPRANDDQQQLEEKLVQLAARIDALKEEQDFLLFQRSIAGSDSKYLLLDLSAGTGTLKYRNRILRTFGFNISSPGHRQIRKGRHVLASKSDGSSKHRELVIDDAFVIHGKAYSGRSSGGKGMPSLVIGQKDLAALFFVVDKGTLLFIQ
jgi:hypothetical protein